jgi:hypothetical protein
MNNRLYCLAQRRERLVALATAQRMLLAQNIEPCRLPLARLDQGLAVLRFVSNHPASVIGSGVFIATLGSGGISKWLRRGWALWQITIQLRDRSQRS